MVAVLELLGVDRSHEAVWQWVHRLVGNESDLPTVSPSRVKVDGITVQIGIKWYRLYAAIDLKSLYLIDIEVSRHHDIDQQRRSWTDSPRATISLRLIS